MRTPRYTSAGIAVTAVIASGTAFFGTLTAASAAPGAPPSAPSKGGAKAGNHMGGGKMAGAMSFTPAQQTQLKAIQADAMKQRAAIMNNAKLTPEQKKMQMQPLMMSMMKKIEAVLTPEQKAVLKKNMAEQLAKRRSMQNSMPTKPGAAPAAPKP